MVYFSPGGHGRLSSDTVGHNAGHVIKLNLFGDILSLNQVVLRRDEHPAVALLLPAALGDPLLQRLLCSYQTNKVNKESRFNACSYLEECCLSVFTKILELTTNY